MSEPGARAEHTATDAPVLDELRRCVQSLAQPAATQRALFPPFVAVGDELALAFDDALRALQAAAPAIPDAQRAALNQLADYLEALSGPANETFWCDPDALATDPRWQQARELARAALAAFDWPNEIPERDGATYVTSNATVRNS